MKVPVTLDEAYNGATIEVPTFTGPVKVRVPPRAQPGSKLRLRGKGIERGNQRGDLYIDLDVRLPDRPDEQLARAIREASDAYTQPVRREMRL
jgi:curved DNA-binding protein